MTLKHSVKPYFKTPKRLRSTPRMTIAEIAAKVTIETKKRSRIVHIDGVRLARTPKILPGWFAYRVSTTNSENGHRYIITVFSPTAVVKSSSKVMIDSPCPLFIFMGYEYVLAKRGNAFIYRSNGQPPLDKNPSMRPGVDHHAYAALRFLVRESRVLVKKGAL